MSLIFEKGINIMRKVSYLLVVVAVLGLATDAQALVTSWYSESNALDGSAAPENPVINANVNDTGTLYVWAQNTATLDGLAYDFIASDVTGTDVAEFVPASSVMYNPGPIFIISNRWTPPVNNGTDTTAQLISNMAAVNVTDASGMNPAVQSFDPQCDAVAGACLVGELQWKAVSAGPDDLTQGEALLSMAMGQSLTTSGGAIEDVVYGTATIKTPVGEAGDIPEPASIALAGLALIGMFGFFRRR